jgi:regulator of cell morphogenesis and NO signaling
MDRLHDAGRSLDAMCDEIAERYHASLYRILPAIAEKLMHVAAMSQSAEFERFKIAFADLAAQIRAHLAKEENLLFPAVVALSTAERAGHARPPLPFATLLHPVRMMEGEHARIEQALDQLRALALAVPEPGSLVPAWRDCMRDLAQLDAELREHHHVENEELFPRALELERHLV